MTTQIGIATQIGIVRKLHSFLVSLLVLLAIGLVSCGEQSVAAGVDGAAPGAALDGSVASRGPGQGSPQSGAPNSELGALDSRSQTPQGSTRANPDPQRGVWTEPLRAIAGRWFDRANKLTKGKAHGRNIELGLQVIDLESGLVLASLSAGRPRRPASNLKLVTTAAALVLFGPNAEFVTSCEAGGEIANGVLAGDLVIRASADPFINQDSDARVEHRFLDVAREIQRAGVQVIAGDLVLDEGTFLDPEPGPAWPDPSQYWQEYCALAGGFSVNGGVMVALVTPTVAGQGARVELHPAPSGLRSILRPMTIAKGGLTIGGEARRGRVLVQGNIPVDANPFAAEFSHEDPVQHFGALFAWALGEVGIRLEGSVVRDRYRSAGTRIAAMRSPVAATLYPINAESRNGVADQLFLGLGHSVGYGGTRAGGQEATRMALERLGVALDGLHQVDGSGLSFDNAIAPAQITGLLAGALRMGPDARRLFLESLAVAGSSGTLQTRMVGTSAQNRVRAKSGWIRGTSALSGIIETLEGRELAFSFLIEYPKAVTGLNRTVLKPMMDELCVYLVEATLPTEALQEMQR